tara:strand:+ start:648 stop:923 length:276 start_codon:yes stop_codon:yes gene_type:complete
LKNFHERFLVKLAALLFLFLLGVMSARCALAKPPVKAKFYDFSEQLIDGQVRKPQALYMDVRQAAKFKRLLRLKRSFMKELFDTARLPVFK